MVQLDPFFSKVLETPSLKLEGELGEGFGTGDNVFGFGSVPTQSPERAFEWQTIGFRLIDTNLKFATKKLLSEAGSIDKEVTIRHAEPVDREEVEAIAASCFKFSRFHLDQKVDNAKADELKKQWAGNYFTGQRGDRMVVAEIGKRVVGFLQLLDRSDETVIDLIAVDRSAQGKGVATAMIDQAHRESRTNQMVVGTQVCNIPSIRLYEKLGFRVIESNYIFHYHGKFDLDRLKHEDR